VAPSTRQEAEGRRLPVEVLRLRCTTHCSRPFDASGAATEMAWRTAASPAEGKRWSFFELDDELNRDQPIRKLEAGELEWAEPNFWPTRWSLNELADELNADESIRTWGFPEPTLWSIASISFISEVEARIEHGVVEGAMPTTLSISLSKSHSKTAMASPRQAGKLCLAIAGEPRQARNARHPVKWLL